MPLKSDSESDSSLGKEAPDSLIPNAQKAENPKTGDLSDNLLETPAELQLRFNTQFSDVNQPQYVQNLQQKVNNYRNLYQRMEAQQSRSVIKSIKRMLKQLQDEITLEMECLPWNLLPPIALHEQIKIQFPNTKLNKNALQLLEDYKEGYQNMVALLKEATEYGKGRLLKLMQTLLYKTKCEVLFELAKQDLNKDIHLYNNPAFAAEGFRLYDTLLDCLRQESLSGENLSKLKLGLSLPSNDNVATSLGISTALIADYQRDGDYACTLENGFRLSDLNQLFKSSSIDDLIKRYHDTITPEQATADINKLTGSDLRLNLLLSGLLNQGGLLFTLYEMLYKSFKIEGQAKNDFVCIDPMRYSHTRFTSSNILSIDVGYSLNIRKQDSVSFRNFYPAPEGHARYSVDFEVVRDTNNQVCNIIKRKENLQVLCINNATYQIRPNVSSLELSKMKNSLWSKKNPKLELYLEAVQTLKF